VFSPGAHVELSEHGDVHIDLASGEPGKYHVFADRTQTEADELGADINWALERSRDMGHRPPEPNNGLVDWIDRDGIIVGYDPDGNIRLGWPAGDNDVDVLDLPPDEAETLAEALTRFGAMALPGEEGQ
jgi:hypothetical protein